MVAVGVIIQFCFRAFVAANLRKFQRRCAHLREPCLSSCVDDIDHRALATRNCTTLASPESLRIHLAGFAEVVFRQRSYPQTKALLTMSWCDEMSFVVALACAFAMWQS